MGVTLHKWVGMPSLPFFSAIHAQHQKTMPTDIEFLHGVWSVNLMHDVVTGRSASGVLEFVDQTLIDWLSKRQGQVETATHGSKFMVA